MDELMTAVVKTEMGKVTITLNRVPAPYGEFLEYRATFTAPSGRVIQAAERIACSACFAGRRYRHTQERLLRLLADRAFQELN